MNNEEAVKEIIAGPKPIAFTVSTQDIRMLTEMRVGRDQYIQLLLAKLRDAGGPVEGVLKLRLAHGKLAKWRDNPLEPQEQFTYMWLPENYVEGIAQSTVMGRA